MRRPNLAGLLAPLRAKLVPDLCTAAEFDALAELGATLPAVAVAGFERRLGHDQAGLDLAICAPIGPAARALRDAGHGGAALRSLLSAAEDPRSPLHERLDLLWLEYDVSRGGRTPSLFVGPRGAERRDAVARASELVLGEPLAGPVADALDRLAAPLAGVELFQVGWMLGRPRPGLRLCFCASDLAAFEALLARLDSASLRSRLRESSRRYAAHVSQLTLAVDIGDGAVGPRVGLELGYGGAAQEVPLQRWDALLQALVDDGLCTAKQLRALLRWSGSEPTPAAPAGLLRAVALRLDRLLHHVKLVFEGDELRGAKVYFGFHQAWTST